MIMHDDFFTCNCILETIKNQFKDEETTKKE